MKTIAEINQIFYPVRVLQGEKQVYIAQRNALMAMPDHCIDVHPESLPDLIVALQKCYDAHRAQSVQENLEGLT